MKKILFLIHDLGQGGAEKVLVNLVNNIDYMKYEVTVMTLFDYGENRKFLNSRIKYKSWCSRMFPGNSHFMKLFSPRLLHKIIIKEHYDIEISYLEGPCARVIAGCEDKNTKLVSWIHSVQDTSQKISVGFRNFREAQKCYEKMKKIVFVSEEVRKRFLSSGIKLNETCVLYNTNESEKIINMGKEKSEILKGDDFKWCGAGKLVQNKGFDRMIRIQKRLQEEGYNLHLYILGEGQKRKELEGLVSSYGLKQNVTFLGYQLNPYMYMKNCDLFVCASYTEGFSTVATEALILGIPVCTTLVSGMKEMLGENNEYGVIAENDEEKLYVEIKRLIDEPSILQSYKEKILERGSFFSTKNTVKAVEEMFEQIGGE